MAATPDTIIIQLDPAALAILERLAQALEALVQQQKIAPPTQSTPSHLGPFLGEE